MWKRGNLLGEGAFGSVYLATSSDQQSVMAVKSSLACESDSLLNEKQVLEDLKGCSNIIHCYGADFTNENGQDFYNLLLEYAAGGTLADRLRNFGPGGLPELDIRRYTRSMLSGLSYMHKYGYVHCDIKPDNILLVENTAKIGDLGLAKKAGETLKSSGKGYDLRGTPMYMAPESVNNEYEPKIDVWALGCTVLELITGKRPWDCEPVAVLYKLAVTDRTPEIPSWVPNEARDFLNKCLERDPILRWTAEMLLNHPYVSSVMDDVAIVKITSLATKTEGAGNIKLRRMAKAIQERKICNFKPIVSSLIAILH